MNALDKFTSAASEAVYGVLPAEAELAEKALAALTLAAPLYARAVAVEAALSLLEDQWNADGFCGSCSWHAAWYEVAENVEESLADQEIWVSCHRKDGEGGDHRGTYLSNPAAALLARLERVLGEGK